MANHGGGAFNYGNVPVKIKGDGDYRSKLAQAEALQSNAFVFGMQQAFTEGAGSVIAANRHPVYGNSNLTAGEGLHGAMGNFKPKRDAVGNQLTTDFNNQTGFGPGIASATSDVQNDPRTIGQNAAMRVAMLQNGSQFGGYNDRVQINKA